MRTKYWLMIIGLIISLILLIIVLSRLNWHTFFAALHTLKFQPLIIAAFFLLSTLVLRALRWNLAAGCPVNQYPAFWQALSIGYLGNTIYPARAGEILRTVAIHHFIHFPLGRAITSVILDRLLDIFSLSVFMFSVLWLHSQQHLGEQFGYHFLTVIIILAISLFLIIIFIEPLYQYAQRKPLPWQKLQTIFLHALDGIRAFKQVHNFFLIAGLSLMIFIVDYYMMWQVMHAFDWHLPFSAAITTGVFIALGSALPSAPGYVGIYQIACVFALQPYGIDESSAIAYSIVLQLLTFSLIILQGSLVSLKCGFNLATHLNALEK